MQQPQFSLSRVRSSLVPARWWLAFSLLAALALPAAAVERTVRIDAPAKAAPGSNVRISTFVKTDAGRGEQIGFFHAEYSTDDGKTWTGYCYEQNMGPYATRHAEFKAGPAGSKILIRVRIAFRGGPAGDVDFNGAALKWKETWEKWQSPPAKLATIEVK